MRGTKNVFLAQIGARGGAWFCLVHCACATLRYGVVDADGISEGSFPREGSDRDWRGHGDRESHHEGADRARMPCRHRLQEEREAGVCGRRYQPHPLQRCGRGCITTTSCIPVSVQYPERRTGNPSISDTNGTKESVQISEVSLFQWLQEQFFGKERSLYI